jgi:hypothetical protein
MATIYDVAKHAGVSVATVSRALNGATTVDPDWPAGCSPRRRRCSTSRTAWRAACAGSARRCGCC